nr:zincin-like metallopeptidase domain-containing protein [Rhodospirillales bacterium]
MASDYVEQVAGSLIEQIRAGTAPWMKPWQPGERFMPYNPTTGNEYHGMNMVWLMSRAESHGYDDARWMTYRQAQEAGAQVRKGETGAPIQYWKWQNIEPVRDEAGKPALDEDGKPAHRLVRYERPRVWSAAVFNATQIDGLPPAPVRPVLAEWERHAKAEAILTNSQAIIRHTPGDHAFYRLAEDAITLPERGQFPTADGYYATALHELSHWTGHPSRLARDLAHPFGSHDYAREELRAEIASLMLAEQLGIGHDPGQHAAYVASWIKVLQQ